MRIGGHPWLVAPRPTPWSRSAPPCVCAPCGPDPSASTWQPTRDVGTGGESTDGGGAHGVVGEGDAGMALDWPDPLEWLAAARAHPLVANGAQAPDDRPLRLAGRCSTCSATGATSRRSEPTGRNGPTCRRRPQGLADGLGRLFPREDADRQRLAAATAAVRGATIVAGGPGTGKTTTVARIIALLRQLEGPQLAVALAAPTGKAAARLPEAVAEAALGMAPEDRARVGQPQASTLHRLLGWRPDSNEPVPPRSEQSPAPRRGHRRRDVHGLAAVDGTASLMPCGRDARLVLVGDPTSWPPSRPAPCSATWSARAGAGLL